MAKAKMLTPEEIAAVLAHVEAHSRYPERDRVLVLLSVRAGLRASEIAGLSWDHILTADMSAVAAEIDLPRQVTKGAKRARLIPIHDELETALEELMALWPDRVTPGQPVVFSERGRYGANGVARPQSVNLFGKPVRRRDGTRVHPIIDRFRSDLAWNRAIMGLFSTLCL